MIEGPPRSGKGTLNLLVNELLGSANCVTPTFSSLTTQFGMQSLIGMSLATLADAHLDRNDARSATEKLKSVSGEDPQLVSRKYIADWNGRLPVRFMILSNELPMFSDTSTAIVDRLLILRLTNSFAKKPDHGLINKLRVELPGIFRWALDGLDSLAKADWKFAVPDSDAESRSMMESLASPVKAFVAEMCVLDPEAVVKKDVLHMAYKGWCLIQGNVSVAKSRFGRDLSTATHGRVKSTKLSDGPGTGTKTQHYKGIKLIPEPTGPGSGPSKNPKKD